MGQQTSKFACKSNEDWQRYAAAEWRSQTARDLDFYLGVERDFVRRGHSQTALQPYYEGTLLPRHVERQKEHEQRSSGPIFHTERRAMERQTWDEARVSSSGADPSISHHGTWPASGRSSTSGRVSFSGTMMGGVSQGAVAAAAAGGALAGLVGPNGAVPDSHASRVGAAVGTVARGHARPPIPAQFDATLTVDARKIKKWRHAVHRSRRHAMLVVLAAVRVRLSMSRTRLQRNSLTWYFPLVLRDRLGSFLQQHAQHMELEHEVAMFQDSLQQLLASRTKTIQSMIAGEKASGGRSTGGGGPGRPSTAAAGSPNSSRKTTTATATNSPVSASGTGASASPASASPTPRPPPGPSPAAGNSLRKLAAAAAAASKASQSVAPVPAASSPPGGAASTGTETSAMASKLHVPLVPAQIHAQAHNPVAMMELSDVELVDSAGTSARSSPSTSFSAAHGREHNSFLHRLEQAGSASMDEAAYDAANGTGSATGSAAGTGIGSRPSMRRVSSLRESGELTRGGGSGGSQQGGGASSRPASPLGADSRTSSGPTPPTLSAAGMASGASSPRMLGRSASTRGAGSGSGGSTLSASVPSSSPPAPTPPKPPAPGQTQSPFHANAHGYGAVPAGKSRSLKAFSSVSMAPAPTPRAVQPYYDSATAKAIFQGNGTRSLSAYSRRRAESSPGVPLVPASEGPADGRASGPTSHQRAASSGGEVPHGRASSTGAVSEIGDAEQAAAAPQEVMMMMTGQALRASWSGGFRVQSARARPHSGTTPEPEYVAPASFLSQFRPTQTSPPAQVPWTHGSSRPSTGTSRPGTGPRRASSSSGAEQLQNSWESASSSASLATKAAAQQPAQQQTGAGGAAVHVVRQRRASDGSPSLSQSARAARTKAMVGEDGAGAAASGRPPGGKRPSAAVIKALVSLAAFKFHEGARKRVADRLERLAEMPPAARQRAADSEMATLKGQVDCSRAGLQACIEQVNCRWGDQRAWGAPQLWEEPADADWTEAQPHVVYKADSIRKLRAGGVAIQLFGSEDCVTLPSGRQVDLWSADPYSLAEECAPEALPADSARTRHEGVSLGTRVLLQLQHAVESLAGPEAVEQLTLLLHLTEPQRQQLLAEMVAHEGVFARLRERILVIIARPQPVLHFDLHTGRVVEATSKPGATLRKHLSLARRADGSSIGGSGGDGGGGAKQQRNGKVNGDGAGSTSGSHGSAGVADDQGEMPPGCGFGMMQLAWVGEALRVTADSEWAPLRGSVIEELADRQVEVLLSHRLWDASLLAEDGALDLRSLTFFLHMHARFGCATATSAVMTFLHASKNAKRYDSLLLTRRSPSPTAAASLAVPLSKSKLLPVTELRAAELASPSMQAILQQARSEDVAMASGLHRYIYHVPSLAVAITSPTVFRPKLALAPGDAGGVMLKMELSDITARHRARCFAMLTARKPVLLCTPQDVAELVPLALAQDRLLESVMRQARRPMLPPSFRHALGRQHAQGHRVLVLVEDNAVSATAVTVAAGLAAATRPSRHDCVHLINVVATEEHARGGEELVAHMLETFRAGHAKNVEVHTHVRVQGKFQGLMEVLGTAVSQLRCDLLVIGSRSLTQGPPGDVALSSLADVPQPPTASTAVACIKALQLPTIIVTFNAKHFARPAGTGAATSPTARPDAPPPVAALLAAEPHSRAAAHFLTSLLDPSARSDTLLLAQVQGVLDPVTHQAPRDSPTAAVLKAALATCQDVAFRHGFRTATPLPLHGVYEKVLLAAAREHGAQLLALQLPPGCGNAPTPQVLQVLRSSPCPVLVFPDRGPAFDAALKL